MENEMVRTLKVEGAALQLVRDLKAHGDATSAKLEEMRRDAEAVIAAAKRVEDDMEARLKDLLDIAADEHCHVDVQYLEEHGVAFARTGCGHGAGGGLQDLLAKMMGGAPAPKPGVH